jgi:hypothetical protein
MDDVSNKADEDEVHDKTDEEDISESWQNLTRLKKLVRSV